MRFLIAVVAMLLLSGCDRKPAAPASPADQTYTIRALVVALPNPPKQALTLHHEAIPNFTGADGKVDGMEEMEMEFPFLAPAVKLDGIAAGDQIEATMEIRWKSQPRFQLTMIRKLPPGTKLNIKPLEPEK